MKQHYFIVFLFMIGISSCNTSGDSKKANEKGLKNGLIHTYNEDGSISASIHYTNGIRNGLATDYYTDGKIRAEINYVQGLKQGQAKWYHKNGKVYRSTEYMSDLREGRQRKYYEDGTLMSEIQFHQNHPGIGLKEYNKYGQERKSKPEFIFGELIPQDDGSFTMEVRLNNKVKEVSFYQGMLKKEIYLHDDLVAINKTANSAFIRFPKGKKQVDIAAKYKTRYKNYRVIIGKASM